jgi:hypothetical protein
MTKKIKENIEKARDYSNKNMEFSALKYWKLAFDLEPNSYRQLMYADQLRLCGMCEQAEKVFSSINVEQIPQRFRHFLMPDIRYYHQVFIQSEMIKPSNIW